MKKSKLFGTLVVMALVSAFMTSCRGTYPTSFVHADAINFGDDVNANFNTKTYEGKPFSLYSEKTSSTGAADAFNQRKKQNEEDNVFSDLKSEIKSAVQQSNTAGIYAMDVALRRVKHMRKVYNRDLNVKYILVYVTDGLDNISVQTAKNNLSFPKKRNYKTPDKYKKKMNKRIKRISKYKKDIKNQFDIYPMVFTGSDLGLVEADILLNNLKVVCQNGYNFKNVNKYNLDTIINVNKCEKYYPTYVNLSPAERIQVYLKTQKKIAISERNKIDEAIKKTTVDFNQFIGENMDWMRGSSRGMRDDECPQIIHASEFEKIRNEFEKEFASSSFEFQVPKGYIKQDVKMTMYDANNNSVDLQGFLKKSLFGKYYLKDVIVSDNFEFVGIKKGKIKKIKAINKSRRDPLAKFVITKPQLVEEDNSDKKPFIVNDNIEQSYRRKNNVIWVDNSEYKHQISAETKTYLQLIFDCSKSLEDQIVDEQEALLDIARIVRESSRIDHVIE